MRVLHPLPPEVYSLIEKTPGAVLLETARAVKSRFLSRLFLNPETTFAPRSTAELDELLVVIDHATAAGKFAAGYFTYECGNCFEPAARSWPARAGKPLAWFGIYSDCHVFDHETGVFVGGEPPALERNAIPEIEEAGPWSLTCGLTAEEYAAKIEAIHNLIRAGDVYQLNYTFPLQLRGTGRAAALYAELRRRQPVEYGAFIQDGEGNLILSFSPELFFAIEERDQKRRIATRPMKGTAPRGRTNEEDARIAAALQNDHKNRSENVMIVDLLRNDLGRLCTFGSVQVDELFAVERYDTLWQMTSTVSGILREDVGARGILRALFPCGSVTGAPKVRAMQLISQMEREPRGIYTGAIGFFSQESSVFNVAIRTLEMEGNSARVGVGSGIVIDSVAAGEFEECQLKAKFVAESAEPFLLIESLRWERGYRFLEMHLDRLVDSAHYFGFPCERANVKAALLAAAEGFSSDVARKVRLTLDRVGRLHTEHEALLGDEKQVLRVRITEERTDSSDRFYFHKTTRRAVYARALKDALADGFDEVLFLNLHGHVTEGAISNVFVERDGRLMTPPVECGLLRGVYRRHLLKTRREIEERVLHIEDLRSAESVYLTNAVRGMRRVVIEWD